MTFQLFEISAQSNYTFNSGYIYSLPNENQKFINIGILGDISSVHLEFNNYSSVNSFLFYKNSEVILSNLENVSPQNNDFEVYPTITSNLLYIINNFKSNTNLITVRIYDILGREVIKTNLYGTKNEIDVSSLIGGSYFLCLDFNNNSSSNYRFSVYK